MTKRPSAGAKERVAQRAHRCCEYCKSRADYSPDTFSIEHIVPRVRGGGNELSNLALSCQGCNNRKFISIGAEDPITGQRVGLFHPRQDRWDDHFTWNEDYSLIIGLTQKGRATVEKLDLNRSGVVNLRQLLTAVGLHPPES